jgi:hypothetical protein
MGHPPRGSKKTPDRSLLDAIEEMVGEGFCGPWVFGTYVCELCGFSKRALAPICSEHHPLEEVLLCDSCGQAEGRFLNLNATQHGGD